MAVKVGRSISGCCLVTDPWRNCRFEKTVIASCYGEMALMTIEFGFLVIVSYLHSDLILQETSKLYET
jgi:hypothetical protein